MKRVFSFIFKSIANYIVQFLFALIIIWLGIPALLPSLKKYSWNFFEDIFSTKINLGIIIITLIIVIILYLLLQKYFLKKSRFKEYGGLLWKVHRKTMEVSKIPYCPKHHAKLVDRYIPHPEYPYSVFYCPICGKNSYPELSSFKIDALYYEAESVIQSKYNK